MLPFAPIVSLLIELDKRTGCLDCFTHAGGKQARSPELKRNLIAVLISHSTNLGLTRMADACGISYDVLAWTAEWYVREETLRAANLAIIDYHQKLPLTPVFGTGTLSSSDGQRFPTRGKSVTARAMSTRRTRTGLLVNFGLFDLLGLQLSPRIRDLGKITLHRTGSRAQVEALYPHTGPLLTRKLNTDLIAEHYGDLLRLARSLKFGHATASLLVGKLPASGRQNALAAALKEYGALRRCPRSAACLRRPRDWTSSLWLKAWPWSPATPERRVPTPFHSQHRAHRGACGKTRVVPQNHRPRPEPTEMGVAKCVCCCRRMGRAGTSNRWWHSRRRCGHSARRCGCARRRTSRSGWPRSACRWCPSARRRAR